ncbi:MAG: hypothetical protein KA368_22545 [Acidobacteria bacterium]|nr:hypothetical protein [Acidobacteriota bacterium]
MKVLTPVIIYFAVPGLGLLFFLRLKDFIVQQQMPSLPDTPLFLVFASYGGWLIVFLTELFWYWSGMASIGVGYLIFVAPIVLGYFAVRLYGQRNQSHFHFKLFIACACYTFLPVAVLISVKLLSS